MDWTLHLAWVMAAGLCTYLFVALLIPEKFS